MEPSNKETFNLLQISDDLKSLSDLELPEILNQRKRKVRRKTRPKPYVHRQQDVSNTNQCNRLIVWVAIFLTSCWLLTLSYMIAVIHSENLRLEVQIKKLSVTSQNLPEALQKWHETSKSLEQNQTIIYEKISELQHNLQNLSVDFSHYKEKLNEKKDYSKDEKFVAEFGAKIEAVSVDVESMKERFSEFQKNQVAFKTDLLDLKGNFSQVVVKASAITANQTSNYSQEISNLRITAFEQIKSLATNLSVVNDTLSQKAKILVEDVVSHKKLLDDLSEIYANTTSHVTSIEDDWMKYKTKVNECETYKSEVNNEISQIKNFTSYLNIAMEDTRSRCGKYHTEMINYINQTKTNKVADVNEKVKNNEGAITPDKLETVQENTDTMSSKSKPTPKTNVKKSEHPHM